MTPISIRVANPEDFPDILALVQELAIFEKAPEQVTNTVEQMEKEQDYFNCLLAETLDKEVIGIALYFFSYSTWVGKSLYLDDLYVKHEYRGGKVGTRLLNEVLSISQKSDCKRVRWQVLDWNKDAITFYEKMGVTIDKQWYNCDTLL